MSTPHSIIQHKNDDPIKHLGEAVSFDRNGKPVSFVFDDTWDYTQSHPHLGTYGLIIFSRYSEYKREIQMTLYKMNKDNEDIVPRSILLEATALNFIAKTIGSAEWSLLALDSEYRKITAKLSQGYSEGTVERYLGVINKLHACNLTERYIKSIKILSEKLGHKSQQHICLPERFAANFFRALIDFVEMYHPYRHEISEVYEKKSAYDTEKLANGYTIGALRKDPHRKNITINGNSIDINRNASLHKKISLACMTLTLAFSGIRFSEALSLEKDAYFTREVNDTTISFICGTTTKTNKGIPNEVNWVTHPIIEKALELAYDSSQWCRKNLIELGGAAERGSLSCFIRATGLRNEAGAASAWYVPSDISRFIGAFCKENKITPTEQDVVEFDLINPTRLGQFVVGFPPVFSSHTFRRSFAVFLCRNQIGSLSALKGQYQHLNAFMTKWYTNNSELAQFMDMRMDADLAADIRRINEDITVQMIFDILNSKTLSGQEGERIIARRNNEDPKMVTMEDIRDNVRSGIYSIVDHPTGYCLNPKCDRICNNDLSTFTCSHEVTTKEKALQRLPELERLKDIFRSTNTGLFSAYGLLKNYQLKIEAIEVTLSKHGVHIEPFRDTIKAKPILVSIGD